MAYEGMTDRNRIEAEMPWEARDLPVTLYGLISRTTEKFPQNNAVSYQIFSGPKDKAETFNWTQLKDKTTQAANLFRSLDIGPKDVVATFFQTVTKRFLAFWVVVLQGSQTRLIRCWTKSKLARFCARQVPKLL